MRNRQISDPVSERAHSPTRSRPRRLPVIATILLLSACAHNNATSAPGADGAAPSPGVTADAPSSATKSDAARRAEACSFFQQHDGTDGPLPTDLGDLNPQAAHVALLKGGNRLIGNVAAHNMLQQASVAAQLEKADTGPADQEDVAELRDGIADGILDALAADLTNGPDGQAVADAKIAITTIYDGAVDAANEQTYLSDADQMAGGDPAFISGITSDVHHSREEIQDDLAAKVPAALGVLCSTASS